MSIRYKLNNSVALTYPLLIYNTKSENKNNIAHHQTILLILSAQVVLMGYHNIFVFIILQCIPKTVSFFCSCIIAYDLTFVHPLSHPILVYVHVLSEQRNTVCVVYISFILFPMCSLFFDFSFFLRKLALLVLINYFF